MSEDNNLTTASNADAASDLRAVYAAPTVSLLFVQGTAYQFSAANDNQGGSSASNG